MSDTPLLPDAAAPFEFPDDLKIRMDKSRSFSEVHGTRGPGDPHQHVHFYQEGLPYDAQGFLILDHHELKGDSKEAIKKRELATKKVKRAMADYSRKKAAAQAEGGPEMPRGIDDADDEEGDGEAPEINLAEWAAGRQAVEWNDVSNAIAGRFKKRVASIADAIIFLVEEGVLPMDAVARKYRKFLS